jgi:hypothetical protein
MAHTNMQGLNRIKTSRYVEATTDSNAPSRTGRIVSRQLRSQDGRTQCTTLERGLRRVEKTPEAVFRAGDRVQRRGQ